MDHPTEQFLERERLSRIVSGPDPPPIIRQRLAELEQLYEPTSDWSNPRNSPHVWLQLVGKAEQEHRDYYASRSMALDLRLRPDHPRRVYRARKDEMRTATQWGQRKLLMAEIAFLTRYGHLSNTVVYAGSARGDHIPLLVELFPHHFHLYDPAPARYVGGPRTTVYEQLFLRADAERWALDGPVLFISDVVTTDSTLEYEQNRERQSRDMRWQMGWVRSMRPAMALLRFALPWPPKPSPEQDTPKHASSKQATSKQALTTTEYLDGELWLQPWMQATSTETRLVTDGLTTRVYDHSVYDEQLAHHNAVVRLSLHNHGLRAVPGLDHCRDCALDVLILREYVEQKSKQASDAARRSPEESIVALLVNISQQLGNVLTEVMDRKATIATVREGQLVAGVLAFEAPLQAAIASGLEY